MRLDLALLLLAVFSAIAVRFGYHRGQRGTKQALLREAQSRTSLAMAAMEDPVSPRAIILLAQAAALCPSQRTHMNLACVLHARGAFPDAKCEYELAGGPGSADHALSGASRLELARIYLNERNWEWAIRHATTALFWFPDSEVDDRADAMIVTAAARWQSGDDAGARADLESALALEPREGLRSVAIALKMSIGMTRAATGGWELLMQHVSLTERVRESSN